MSEPPYADAVDYQYLRARLREAKILLDAVLHDSELNVSTPIGQTIHAWLADYQSPETVKAEGPCD